jgi:hypothetical protein
MGRRKRFLYMWLNEAGNLFKQNVGVRGRESEGDKRNERGGNMEREEGEVGVMLVRLRSSKCCQGQPAEVLYLTARNKAQWVGRWGDNEGGAQTDGRGERQQQVKLQVPCLYSVQS